MGSQDKRVWKGVRGMIDGALGWGRGAQCPAGGEPSPLRRPATLGRRWAEERGRGRDGDDGRCPDNDHS